MPPDGQGIAEAGDGCSDRSTRGEDDLVRVVMSTQAMASTGGIELTALQIGRELAARGHSLSVIATHGGDLELPFRSIADHVSTHGNFQHTIFSKWQLLAPLDLGRWARSSLSAVRAGRAARPDIIYANAFFSLPWALATARVTAAPIVCHLHGCAGGPLGRQASAWARGVDAFIAPSEFVRNEWVQNGLPAEKIRTIYGGVAPGEYPPGEAADQAEARRILGLPPDAFTALFLGRVVPEKGVEVLLDAWKLVDLDPSEGRLLIVGPGNSGYVRALAAGTDAAFLPTRAEVITPLHAADVVVVPSQWDEPFGRVVIEAMAAGRPVLAARSGGIPEILTGQFAGNLFEKGDTEALSHLLRRAIAGRGRQPDLSNRCASHIREHFSLTDRVNELEALFLEVVKA
jgi:glycosyltransferase involved in cell wall biosynthesis